MSPDFKDIWTDFNWKRSSELENIKWNSNWDQEVGAETMYCKPQKLWITFWTQGLEYGFYKQPAWEKRFYSDSVEDDICKYISYVCYTYDIYAYINIFFSLAGKISKCI